MNQMEAMVSTLWPKLETAESAPHGLLQRLKLVDELLKDAPPPRDSACLACRVSCGHALCLRIQESFTVGRSKRNDWHVDDMQLSRHHFRIVRARPAGETQAGATAPETFVLEDCHSKNGTSVNGQPVHQRLLVSGDVIEAGGYLFAFLSRADNDPEPGDPA